MIPLMKSTSMNFQNDYVKLNKCFDISYSCANATYNNISSIIYPNSTKVLFSPEQNMTQTGTDFNFPTCDFSSELGYLHVNGHCDAYGTDAVWEKTYLITRTGYQQTTGEGINAFAYLALMVFLTCFFIYAGFKLSETEELWVLGIFLFFLAFIFVIYDSWLGYEYQLKYVGAAASSAIPEVLFYILLLVISAGLLTAGILLFKRIPKIIKLLQVKFKKNKDGWDGGDY